MTTYQPRHANDDEQTERPPAGGLHTPEPGGDAGPGSHYDPTSTIAAPPQTRRHRRLALGLALLFFFVPAAAYVLGARPAEIENHRLASFPSLSDGWHFFGDFQKWAIDHLPLRDKAVSANTKLSEGVFGQTPQYGQGGSEALGPIAAVPAGGTGNSSGSQFPKVFAGKDGWLYFGADMANPCQPASPPADVLRNVDRLARILAESGRRFVFTVPPDKSTMEPQFLPASYVGKDCAPTQRTRFWHQIDTAPPTGYVDLRGSLQRLQAQQGHPVYRPHDTHWAPRGAALYAEKLARALDPRLWSTSRLVSTGPLRLHADLAAMLGTPRTDTVTGYRVVRDGVHNQEDTASRVVNTTTGAPLFDPPTLLLGDSFTESAHEMIAPLFRQLTIVQPKAAADEPDLVLSQVKESKVVVLEVVERTMDGGNCAVLDPAFLDRLATALHVKG